MASTNDRKLFDESTYNKQIFLALRLQSWLAFEHAGDYNFDTLAKV